MMMKKQLLSVMMLIFMTAGMALLPEAEAKRCWRDQHYRLHCDNGNHKGWSRYDNRSYRREPLVDYKTGKILKGGLIGAGVGAATGAVLNRPIGKTAVVGAGIGAGTQAVRYSGYMDRHPIVKTATYGALAGVGASQLVREGSPVKGALWGAAIGTGVGVLKDSNDYDD